MFNHSIFDDDDDDNNIKGICYDRLFKSFIDIDLHNKHKGGLQVNRICAKKLDLDIFNKCQFADMKYKIVGI